MSGQVFLQCLKVGSKLRVRIISPGFNHTANCQFPRNVRLAGRKFAVPPSSITFAEGPNHKFFYRVNKNYITILDQSESTDNIVSTEINEQLLKDIKIFENLDDEDCIICMDIKKDVVFAPCGHYCSCSSCAMIVKNGQGKCPICRSLISIIVKRDQIQT
jgi:hypothetical protein